MPMGVAMLPRFAAIVCKTTIRTAHFCCPQRVSAVRQKGTNVTRDTSLVMIMLVKKHISISICARRRRCLMRTNAFAISQLNMPMFCSPRTRSIRANSSASTRTST